MSLLEALVYGMVQGIAEYLPISSSAHLILLPKFLGTQDPGLAFDVFLHLGTFFATVGYFWKEWAQILATLPGVGGIFKKAKTEGTATAETATTLTWIHLAIGTVPALIAGALIHHWAETALRGVEVLATTLALGGVLLYAVDRWAPATRSAKNIRFKDALIIGGFQCLALVPGMSRSGSTIMGGRFLKLDRVSAAQFSFLLSAPITLAALVFELRKWNELLHGPVGVPSLVVAGVSSFVFGALTISFLLKLVRRFSTLSFCIYRLVLAAVVYGMLRG